MRARVVGLSRTFDELLLRVVFMAGGRVPTRTLSRSQFVEVIKSPLPCEHSENGIKSISCMVYYSLLPSTISPQTNTFRDIFDDVVFCVVFSFNLQRGQYFLLDGQSLGQTATCVSLWPWRHGAVSSDPVGLYGLHNARWWWHSQVLLHHKQSRLPTCLPKGW